jgi:hypothetical protein
MKVSYKLAVLASTALFLGGIPAIAQESPLPKPETQMCTGGGYPITVCEIINGKRVCRRECP